MYQIYPPVKKIELTGDTFSKKEFNTVFFNSMCANVFNFLKAFINVKEGTKEEANIIYLKNEELNDEAYDIVINQDKINICFGADVGAFYATKTLKQIFDKSNDIKCLHIFDEPDLKTRGFMLDISRNKVPKVSEIKKIIDVMADLKMNHLELYVEGFSFYYPSFSKYCQENSSITIDEYKDIERYANERYIDLVPNQNGFGHMAKWLEKDEFKQLAECEDGIFLWGMQRKASTLNPLDERSIELIRKMYADMLPITKSKYFNMNFDEPFELGKGKSKEECLKNGVGKVYLDYALKAIDIIKGYEKTPLIWGDVLINHPDLLSYLPKDMIFVDWGYDGTYPYEKHLKMLSELGIKFMAAPGSTSWCSFAGRTMDYLETIKNSCYNVKKYNGEGAILTDWGDFGHLQFFLTTYAPLVYFGLMSYRCTDGTYFLLKDYLNKIIFKDENKIIADYLIDLGNYYRYEDCYHGNGTKTFYSFMFMWMAMKEENPIDFFKEKIKGQILPYNNYLMLESFLNQKLVELKLTKMEVDDAYLLVDEIKQTINIIKLIQKTSICFNETVSKDKRITLIEDVLEKENETIEKQKKLWLARNKSGNLDDTLSYLKIFFSFVKLTRDYLLRGETDER